MCFLQYSKNFDILDHHKTWWKEKDGEATQHLLMFSLS